MTPSTHPAETRTAHTRRCERPRRRLGDATLVVAMLALTTVALGRAWATTTRALAEWTTPSYVAPRLVLPDPSTWETRDLLGL